jgi:membrane dipeptidase
MERAGMILDATHLADKSFWQSLEIYGGPVLASHHNCRALVPGDRQLSDEQIKALIARGAVIGASFDNWMLKPGWKIGVSSPESVSLEDVVNHTDHICQLAGNARHCGLGTDLDGGFGKEQSPHDLDTIADLPKVAEILSRRGYSTDDVERILWRNFVEFFAKALPSHAPPAKSQPAA